MTIGVIRVRIARRSVLLGVPYGKSGFSRCGMRFASLSEKREKKGIRDMADKEYIERGKLIEDLKILAKAQEPYKQSTILGVIVTIS